jgi:hypothetical protein
MKNHWLKLVLAILLASVIMLGFGCPKKSGGKDTTSGSSTLTPPPPSSLTASAISSTLISLTWQDNYSNGEIGVSLERKALYPNNLEYSYSQFGIILPPNNVTSYDDNPVTDASIYYYRIRTWNGYGTSGYSNETSVTIPPNAPSSLIAVPVSSSQIDLSWINNSTNTTSFLLECIGYVDRIVSGTSYSWKLLLQPGTTYSFRVYARNSLTGPSDPSNEASATTFP